MNFIKHQHFNPSVTTAVIPAAGNGKRLRPATSNKPKCLIEINGQPLLKYTLDALESHGYTRLVLVTGYRSGMVEAYIRTYNGPLSIETIQNPLFSTTNNIYSIYLAMQRLQSGFTIIESDLIFEAEALEFLRQPDTAALDRYDTALHNGTTVTVSEEGFINTMNIGAAPNQNLHNCCKTVNIWSFSQENAAFFYKEICRLINLNQTNCFYEAAIKNLIDSGQLTLRGVDFSRYWWDEIDTRQDLDRVNKNLVVQPLGLVV